MDQKQKVLYVHSTQQRSFCWARIRRSRRRHPLFAFSGMTRTSSGTLVVVRVLLELAFVWLTLWRQILSSPQPVIQPCLAMSPSAPHSSASATNRRKTNGTTTSTSSTYQYFAIGSNMVPATMTALRQLKPLSSTAAILPGYELAFDIPTGIWLEPSAASVRRQQRRVVHGVLYQLSETDFARLGSSEGVPGIYTWETCRVVPYRGDSQCAGRTALAAHYNNNHKTNSTVEALVLTTSPLLRSIMRMRMMSATRNPVEENEDADSVLPDIPPSPSYLRILRDGAAYWQMDRDYQAMLAAVPVSPYTPGMADWILQMARRFRPSSSL